MGKALLQEMNGEAADGEVEEEYVTIAHCSNTVISNIGTTLQLKESVSRSYGP